MTDTVSGVNNYITISEATKNRQETTKTEDGLGADAFMQLLLTQLKNQDPLEPLKENEMITQMAQLNSVQELRTMNTSLSSLNLSNQLQSGSSMIGKLVSYTNTDGDILEGIVHSVSVKENSVLLNINNQLIPFASITGVQKEENE
jgi:flagellar basal-body rod modification protein FlgD